MAAPDDGSVAAPEPSRSARALAPPDRRALAAVLARWVPLEIALVTVVGVAAARVLHLANSDALLPSLMSTQRMTWFYWGQDRLANVVPALAMPVQDVRWNLSVQVFLVGLGWFSLSALFAADQFLRRGHRVNPVHVAVVTLAAGAATWILLPPRTEQVLVFEQMYAFALTLFLLGMLGATKGEWRWRALGAVAIGAAMLINPSLLLYAPFVVFLPDVRALRRRGRLPVPTSQILIPLVFAVLAFLATNLAADAFGHEPARETGYNEFSLDKMLDNFGDALGNVADSVRGFPTLVALPLAAVLVAARARAAGWRLVALPVSAAAFAIVWTFVFSGNTWVIANLLMPRYFFPVHAAGLLVVVAAIVEVVQIAASREPLGAWGVRGRRRPRLTAPVALILAAVAPIAGVALMRTTDVDALERAEGHVVAIQAHDVDLVAGGYWAAWPAVIEARARGLGVLGVSDRTVAVESLVVDRIRGDLEAGDPIVVLCTDIDGPACLAAVAEWAPRELVVQRSISSSPLVLELGPAG